MRIFKGLFVFFTLVSCVSSPLSQESRLKSVEAKHGVVSAAHPLASEAGVRILEEGGNAIDAALAASFAISVLRPQSSGLGGGGFALLYRKSEGKVHAFDFRERAPRKSTEKLFQNKDGSLKDFFYRKKKVGPASVDGHLAVGVPGLIAGLLDMHKKYGTLSLQKIMEPAIELAEKGFPVYKILKDSIEDRESVLRSFEHSRRIFLPNGKVPEVGDLLVQKELANSLKMIAAQGANVFYRGHIARSIVQEMKEAGGLITERDLNEYKVVERAPVEGEYRDYKIVGMPPPSSGGVHIIQILNMLSKDDVGALKHNSVEYVHLLAESMRRAFADRSEYLGDPDFVKVPVKGLLSKDYAMKLRKSIDGEHASLSKNLKAGDPSRYESPSTTHISVVDSWGNAVSSTQTVNGLFGSGVTVEGIVLNNEMDDFAARPGTPNIFGLVTNKANAVAPGKTMLSSMSPTLVFDERGNLKWILGSPGGPRIITATLQTLINVIDFKMPLPEAVQAPRVHHQWLPDELSMEKDALSEDVVKALEAKGHKLVVPTWVVGDVQAIGKLENANWIGVSDKRSDGHPKGF